MGHEVQYTKCHIMSIASGKSHPTYLYNLCGHILYSVQLAKYIEIVLTDKLCWSSHVHSIHSRANSTPGWSLHGCGFSAEGSSSESPGGLSEEEPSALSCQT